MKALIHRQMLQPLGLAYEKRNLVPDGNAAGITQAMEPGVCSNAVPVSSVWALEDIRLRAGWYMLEIEHSSSSIGSTLSFELPSGEQHYLLLTSKPICKRVVWLDEHLTHCHVRIDQSDCPLSVLRLTALSERFAITRLMRRLKNRGSCEDLATLDIQRLYSAYQHQLHDGILPQVYKPVVPDTASITASFQGSSAQLTANRLLLLRRSATDADEPDPSVEVALNFARQCGWNIDWCNAQQLQLLGETSNAEPRLFFMPVPPDVEYRIDVFHQMLKAVKSDTRLMYADHDHLSSCGDSVNPVLKPEWNPELLLNTDYIQLPWMMSLNGLGQTMIDYLAGNPEAYSVLPDLVFGAGPESKQKLNGAVTAALKDSEVIRIPRVLASLRMSPSGQTLLKPCSSQMWRSRVVQVLHKVGRKVDIAQGAAVGRHRIVWPLPTRKPRVDIIVPTRDQVSVLRTCIESIISKTQYADYRILLVDNNSRESATEAYYCSLLDETRIELLRYEGAFNYSAINNFAAGHSRADVLVLLNNDTEVLSAQWLDEMVRQACRTEVGCVGAKLYYSNGRIQHAGVILGITGIAGHAYRYSHGSYEGYCGRLLLSQNVSAVTAACLAVRRSVWDEVGGLDAEHLGVAWNDVDFCLRVKALGYRNVWTPHAELFHHEGLSRGADDTPAKIRRADAERQTMLKRWRLDNYSDSAYHPLLTRDNERFTLGNTIT